MKLTVNVDMDGVLYDFNGYMTSLAEVYLDRDLPDAEGWEMWDTWGIDKKRFYELFHRAIGEDGLFFEGAAIDGGVEAVRRLAKKHRVRIVTAKRLRDSYSTYLAQRQTQAWLYQHGLLQHVELVFATDKQGYGADLIIDDKPTLQWAQDGKVNLLFDQPWNRDAYAASHRYDLYRMFDWDEVDGWAEYAQTEKGISNVL